MQEKEGQKRQEETDERRIKIEVGLVTERKKNTTRFVCLLFH